MSPKNKGTFGKGKSAIEPEDEFISTMGRVGAALKPHTTKIVIGCSIVMLALIAVFTYRWWDHRQQAKATFIYDQAVTIVRVPIIPEPVPEDSAEGKDGEDGNAEGEAAAPTPTGPKDEDHDGIPDSFSSRAERAQAVLAILDRLRSEYGSTQAAKESGLLYASMLYDAGRYADAAAMYQTYLGSGVVGPLKVVAREGLGYAQEAQAMGLEDQQARAAGLEKALQTFGSIQRDDKGPDRDRALYHEARILAELGRKEEAVAALKKALEIKPEGGLKYDINQRLAHLQAGQPAPAPSEQ